MELERNAIERTDFAAARRGYDPEEVDRHLREIGEAVDELKRQGQGGGLAERMGPPYRIALRRGSSALHRRAQLRDDDRAR